MEFLETLKKSEPATIVNPKYYFFKENKINFCETLKINTKLDSKFVNERILNVVKFKITYLNIRKLQED